MNQVLNDNRELRAMTVEAADALFAEIANTELEVIKIKATGDLEVARITAEYELKMAQRQPVLKEKKDILTSYIQANPERFEKPRARKTAFGTYGKGSVSGVVIISKDLVLQYATDNKLPQLYKTTVKIIKKAVEKMVKEGFTIPGTKVNSGERIRIKVSQDLMDQAAAVTIIK